MTSNPGAQQKTIDVIAFGTCYVDINVTNYPFGNEGIAVESELIGGAYESVAGGSAVNFCRMLENQGLKTAFIGMTGVDKMGNIIEESLQQCNIQSILLTRPDLHTNISFNMTSPDGQHILCVAGTANASLNPDVVIPKLQDLSNAARLLYIGGCFKLTTFVNDFSTIVDSVRDSLSVVIDHGRIPKNTSAEMLAAVRQLVIRSHYYLPSRKEFLALWKVKNIEEGLQALELKAPQLVTVVKDGANGAYFWHNSTLHHAPGNVIDKMVNVTGAGDSFNSGFIYATLHQSSIRDAVSYGGLVAASKISGKPIPPLV